MKKIKLFLITLLCMVGVVNAVADDVINSSSNALKEGNTFLFKWKQEVPAKYGVYKIANARELSNNKVAIVAEDGNSFVDDILAAGAYAVNVDAGSKDRDYLKCGDNYLYTTGLDHHKYKIDARASVKVNNVTYSGHRMHYQFGGFIGEMYLWYQNGAFPTPSVRTRNDGFDLWNFYSMQQVVSYEDFKEAYEALISLRDEIADDRLTTLNSYIMSLISECSEIGGFCGSTDAERTTTKNKVEEIWDFIYNLKGSNGEEGSENADGLIKNPDGEQTMYGWNFERINGIGEYMGTGKHCDSPWKDDDEYFDIRNASMTQTVHGLKNGIWRVSCYYQADDLGTKLTLMASTTAHSKHVEAEGTGTQDGTALGDLQGGTSLGWHELETPEVVVVDNRLTISASAVTPPDQQSHWCNIDHFRLEYICANRMIEQADGTRLFEGVYDGFSGEKDPENAFEVTDNFPYADVKDAYYSKAYNPTLIHTNPNGLFYARANDTKVSDNNVIKDGTCANLVLSDGHPYSAKADFTAKSATYEMLAVGTNGNGESFGTLMLPYDVQVPTGIIAWKVTAASDGSSVNLESLTANYENVIPANSPVLVSGKAKFDKAVVNEEDPAFAVSRGVEDSFGSLNGIYKFVPGENGALVPFKAPVGSYVLQKQGSRVAFYHVEGGTTSSPAVKPFRSYLTLPGAANANALSFVFIDDETAGISDIEFECENGAIYDLSGRRVQQLVRGGIYIVNGKKFMVK